jgi:hypothetical protein
LNSSNLGAVRNFPTTLPASHRLFFGRFKVAAINGGDGDILPEDNLRADLQEVKLLVCCQPFVETLRSHREHLLIVRRPMGHLVERTSSRPGVAPAEVPRLFCGALFRQLRNLIRTSITQDCMELNRNGTIRVHQCGVREGRHSSAIKGNLDVLLRQPFNR